METKELKIQIPDGYQIDEVNSTLELIKFKPIEKATYENISKELFKEGGFFFTSRGTFFSLNMNGDESSEFNNCTSEEQAKKVLAINKLLNVAKYLNKGWKPNWENRTEDKWYIEESEGQPIYTDNTVLYNCRICYFKSEELAEQAIKILGKETIKLALSTDY